MSTLNQFLRGEMVCFARKSRIKVINCLMNLTSGTCTHCEQGKNLKRKYMDIKEEIEYQKQRRELRKKRTGNGYQLRRDRWAKMGITPLTRCGMKQVES